MEEKADRKQQREGDDSDDGDEGDEGNGEEQEEEEDVDEDDDEEEQSDYDGEGGGSEDDAAAAEEEEDDEEQEHDLDVVDLSENNADKTVETPASQQRADPQDEQQALQGIIDNVASFSVGHGQPAEEQEEPGEERVSAAVAVLTEAERGVRTAKALAEAAAMQELSSKLFPLLVERLPQILGQDTAEPPAGELFVTDDSLLLLPTQAIGRMCGLR